MTKISAKATLNMTSSLSVEGRVKHSFSKQHFRAARYFADRSVKIESENQHDTDDETFKSVYRSYVTGAILSTVAGLEASINEMYLEACDRNNNTLKGLSENDLDKLDEWWEQLERTRSPFLLKYQMALMLTEKKKFDRGTQPYQDADSLVRLRNALVHYKPEWDTNLNRHEDLQNRLELRFTPNPFTSNNSQWFPHQCLGSGCALWSIGTSGAFMASFCQKIGIPNRM